MLQGFEKGKLTRLLTEAEGHFPREDLLTAAVLGTSAYVEPALAAKMLRAVFGNEFEIPDHPNEITVDFWGRMLKNENPGWIEPDAVINIASDVPLRFIVEAKWQSGFGPQQALKQWQHLKGEDGVQTWHVFPVQNKPAAMAQLEDDEAAAKEEMGNDGYLIWKQSRRCISWFDISMRLMNEISRPARVREDVRLHLWATGVLCVLQQIGEKAFEGFEHIRRYNIDPVEIPVCWKGVTPTHFHWPMPIFVPAQRTVFFKAIGAKSR